MTRDWTEEQIAALIDGSIGDEEEASALRRLLERDPEAQSYAARIERANALLREAFETPADEPTPAAIQAAIFGDGDKVSPFKPRRAAGAWMPTAIAASIALVIGLGVGTQVGESPSRVIAALGETPLESPLHEALERLPSGAISDAGVQPMLTFWDGDGRACREFEVLRELPEELEFGIACRNDVGLWHVEIVVTAPVTEPGPEGYAPASGAGSDALDAMLDALGAGPALGPGAEATLLEQGW